MSGSRLGLAISLALASSGCTSSRAVLVNDKEERLTCAATSVGIISTLVQQSRYEDCLTDAKANGYRVEYQQ